MTQSVKKSAYNVGDLGSLAWEYSPEEGMATHSSILAQRIPMYRGSWPARVHGVTELDMAERLSTAHGRKE